MSTMLLPVRTTAELVARSRSVIDANTHATVREIIEQVRWGGRVAVESLSLTLGDRTKAMPLLLERAALDAALVSLPREDRATLERVAARIAAFAEAQRAALADVTVAVPGGRAGHTVRAVDRAGCYAPGGRYPLPSSVLMTAITARVAGVASITVAGPRPTPVTLAAAAIGGAEAFLVAGGAQAIAALALGIEGLAAVDVVVGPGNRFVSAAKQQLFGTVGIDMIAGPTELVILADANADPECVSADLIAQAEHDPDALPVLVTDSESLVLQVREALARQLVSLSTCAIAEEALRGGGIVMVPDLMAGVETCNALAPEHLELVVREPDTLRSSLRHHGALFVGSQSAEVFGDYGAGPNHVLPTSGSARFTGGLSVFSFLRVSSWLALDQGRVDAQLIADAAWLARAEGLEGHARAAERRSSSAVT